MSTISTPSTSHRMNEITEQSNTKVIISKRLQAMIAYAHRVVGDIEWSGYVLFKEQSGSPATKDLVLYADYMHIMDVGTSGYTEFTVDEAVLEMLDEFPEALDYKMAAIHTHHSMGCFFSGTDMQELHDNAGKYPYYLSLIVNHKGQYCAKVAWVVSDPGRTIKTAWGKYEMPSKDYLVHSDCTIQFEVDEVFSTRMNKLMEAGRTRVSKFTNFKLGTESTTPSSWKDKWEGFYDKNKSNGKGKQGKLFKDEPLAHWDSLDWPEKPKAESVDDLFADLLTQEELLAVTVKVLSQDTLCEDDLGTVIVGLTKQYKKPSDIDDFVEMVDATIPDYVEIVTNKPTTIDNLNNVARRMANLLNMYTHYPVIDELRDRLLVEYID